MAPAFGGSPATRRRSRPILPPRGTMRSHALFLLAGIAALAAAPAAPARAQDPAPRTVAEAGLPAHVAERITGFFNDPATIQFSGDTRIPAERTISGDVAVLGGPVSIAGRVEGDIVVLNGDVELLPGAAITGSLTVVGGRVTGEDGARIGGEVAVYSERVDYRRRAGRITVERRGRERERTPEPTVAVEADTIPGEPRSAEEEDDGWTRGEDDWESEGEDRGRADFVVATGQSYNRVEGLPITFGPVFETTGSNPFRLRLMGIYRTENGPVEGGRWGFDARAEQFLGGNRAFRVGGALYSRIDPIEDWHLTKLENGLSTFFLHRDYRDHYDREGGSVYAMLTPPSLPVSATLTYRNEHHDEQAAGSPWTIFNNDEPWRRQPLAANGQLQSLSLAARVDTRSEELDPATGWYVDAEVEQGLDVALRQQETFWVNSPSVGFPGPALPRRDYGNFTRGTIDIRRYNRISASSRLNLRFMAGGSLDGSPLPPQRQHALGGEGSLPGYALFSVDCGARSRRVIQSRSSRPLRDEPEFYSAYGCDRFVLGQVEYRGDLSFHLNLMDWDEEEEGEEGQWGEDEAGDEPDFRADFGWVLFADVGRAWTRSFPLIPELRDEETAADVGAGILLGRLGIYLAVPVADKGGVNVFIRLSPRF